MQEASRILVGLQEREDESMKVYLTHFNKERMTVDDQYEKIMLATLLGDIWLSSHFMAELARKTPPHYENLWISLTTSSISRTHLLP